MSGNEVMVKFLCEQGADVTLMDNELHSSVHWITGRIRSEWKRTIECFAILVCGHAHLLDILIRYKAPLHTADMHSAYPIHYASQLSGSAEDAAGQLKSSNGRGKFSRNARTVLDELGLAILQKLIDRKVDLDCVDGQNRTPFMWAASTGN